MKKFKFEETNKYSKLRNRMIDFALDGLQTKFVIQNVYNETPNFGVGRLHFVCEDIFKYEVVDGTYLGEICDGYHVYAKN